jgi:hypothetical protein
MVEEQIRPTLFVSAKLQKQGHKSEKTVLGSSPIGGVLCTLETNDGRRTDKTSIVCFGEEITGTKASTPVS